MIYIKFCENEHNDSISNHRAARYALFDMLYRAFGVKYADDNIRIAPGGKPYIENAPFDFSCAHTNGAVAVAATGAGEEKEGLICINKNARKIGVDIERADRDVKNKDLIIEKFFSNEEKDYAVNNERFLEIWTKKESVAKVTGEGLKGIKKADTFSFSGFLQTDYIDIGGKKYIVSVAGI